MPAIETGPEFPRFQDREIETLAIMGAEKVSIPLFENGVRSALFASPSHLCYFGFSFRWHLVLLSTRSRKVLSTFAKKRG